MLQLYVSYVQFDPKTVSFLQVYNFAEYVTNKVLTHWIIIVL